MTEKKTDRLSQNIELLIRTTVAEGVSTLLRQDLSNLSDTGKEKLVVGISEKLIDSNNFLESIVSKVEQRLSSQRKKRLMACINQVMFFIGWLVIVVISFIAASDTISNWFLSMVIMILGDSQSLR